VPPNIPNSEAGRRLPFGLGTGAIPVWGTFQDGKQTTGELRTAWYRLPDQARSGAAPVVLTVGGQIDAGNTVMLELGRLSGSTVTPIQQVELPDVPDATTDTSGDWRDLRLGLSGPLATAEVVRVVATDRNLSEDGWLGVSAPRVPRLVSVRELVGDDAAYLQWPVPFVYPCLRQFAVRDGVAEMPRYLIAPENTGQPSASGWAAPQVGGVQGHIDLLARRRQLPSYLAGTWSGDWGTVYALDPFATAEQVQPHRGEQVRSGLWTPGPMHVERP
jgi:arabinosyltransferase C